jgi:hypothetical protein
MLTAVVIVLPDVDQASIGSSLDMSPVALASHGRFRFISTSFEGLGCGKFPVSVWLGRVGRRLEAMKQCKAPSL